MHLFIFLLYIYPFIHLGVYIILYYIILCIYVYNIFDIPSDWYSRFIYELMYIFVLIYQ